ncbi:MAG: glycosyltransferase [Chitinophagaceae bacterium]|nr:glycosyltransferase [Chitinophagaceae bacterium]
MKLSVIIINYNVKYFLEQCLHSVVKATQQIDAEIIVIDNCSTDGSIAYLQPKFFQVHFVENTENIGFGKANNQALSIAKGEYVLFLNPDTIVPENCFTESIAFYEQTPNCGALGIKMVDGKGVFLPESKRAFPSPLTSFFKLVGLATIFPKSAIFNKYALGHLSENENHEVDVLAGAFMLLSKEVLQKVKGFDDTFFMYGEDVDLSYRIQAAGYKNYYFSNCSIIHFKGESTKKGSLNYVRMFYQAMSIFVQKHYSGSKAFIFSFLIQLAIGARAVVSLLSGLLTKWGIAIADAIVVFGSLWCVETYWVKFIRDGGGFNVEVLNFTMPMFTIIFLIAAALAGMYDNLYKPSKVLLASATAIVILLAAYSLLPEKYRFSRGVILMGGIVAGLMITLVRWILIELKWIKKTNTEENKFQQTVIVGSVDEYNNVISIMTQANVQDRVLGRIKATNDNANAIGNYFNLQHLVNHLNIREVVFCEGSLTFTEIIASLAGLPKHINYRFMAMNSHSIIGSDSKATTGEVVTADGYFQLAQPYQKRMKRIVDIAFALFFLISFPYQLIRLKNGLQLIKNAFAVLIGNNTWVGYIIPQKKLPFITLPIITHFGLPYGKEHPLNKDSLSKLDTVYAKHYEWLLDVKIILQNYKSLTGSVNGK